MTELKGIPTNDFDLSKEKKLKTSTFKRQKKDTLNIIERTANLQKINVNLLFDRLKIWVDLGENGEKVGFRLGQLMEKSEISYLSPEKKWMVENKKINIPNVKNPYSDAKEEDNEISINKNRKENKYPNCSINYNLYRNTIGINNIYIYNDILVIDITGKFMADYGDLGYLHTNNINEVLDKLKNLGLFSFNNANFLKYAGCFLCDCTLDILFPHETQIIRMINAIGSFCPIISDITKAYKYQYNGILMKRNTLIDQGFSFIFYRKYKELKNSILRETKPVTYTQTIGESGENIAKHTLRLECHLYKMDAIRKFLMIEPKTKGIVLLKDVLKSKEPVILNVLKNLGIDISDLYKRLDGYELNPNFFNKDDYMPFDYFKKMFLAESLANLLKENNFNLPALKNHLLTEYNLDISNPLVNKQINTIKLYLFDFLIFNKPKTVSSIILLLTLITDVYFGELPPKKTVKHRRTKKIKETKGKVLVNFN